mmetsp:Transcript_15432/g.24219  ORF Transcript_15432/g.24219 Transcript_15432/m.24219 type:complete len:146 (+) Transcript_15432:78-515(+)|eukprot:CAMPEP_0116999266 /NCGR_PEP_ID=MMETSP0472-20121206/2036_1 /TAXON_ID=693140 ORGANISM="Tiarina fusus, Strain LIS" /NCGR_SAMPLE_ID=MMETSP0472 /ASSEMBLY_ACC=CAM_ASM_000603 /LENGTH=145 /DNA_ID=CAMNT_0004698643 /DNA_START=76 /DNA_END=513 /DNA_ORIENTATION=-
MSVQQQRQLTFRPRSFGMSDDASALTEPNAGADTVNSAFSRGDYEKGFELFGDDVADFINSFDVDLDIEKHTGVSFTTVHEMFVDSPCVKGFFEPEEGDSKIEVEFNGDRDLVMYSSIECSSVNEVKFKGKRKGLFRGLSSRRKY